MIRWSCQQCSEALEAPESMADGGHVRCPKCHAANGVPPNMHGSPKSRLKFRVSGHDNKHGQIRTVVIEARGRFDAAAQAEKHGIAHVWTIEQFEDDPMLEEADIKKALTIIDRLTGAKFGPWLDARKRLQSMIFLPVLKVAIIFWLLTSVTSCTLTWWAIDSLRPRTLYRY